MTEQTWSVNPWVFRCEVVAYTIAHRDVFGTLTADQMDYLVPRLMEGFFSFGFADILKSVGDRKMIARITGVLLELTKVEESK